MVVEELVCDVGDVLWPAPAEPVVGADELEPQPVAAAAISRHAAATARIGLPQGYAMPGMVRIRLVGACHTASVGPRSVCGMKLFRTLLISFAGVAAVVLVSAAMASAAAPWKLSARAHSSGVQTSPTTTHYSLSHNGFAGAKQIAISMKGSRRSALAVVWVLLCAPPAAPGKIPAPETKQSHGAFTSYGLGTKIPIKFKLPGKVGECSLDVTVTPSGKPQLTSLYISAWRR